MGRGTAALLLILCVTWTNHCLAQSGFDVSDPSFELKDNSVLIAFDILNSSPSDDFEISIEISDTDGNKIKANALSGDIGEGIPGGNNKVITWDLEADNIVMDAEIVVNIYAKLIPPPSPKQKTIENNYPDAEKEFNRTGLILQSIALPGLGLSRLTGKPHWVRGIAGYGCIAGSVALNKMAISTYDDFLSAETTEDSDLYWTRTMQQDNISEVLAYAAIGIWITDIIWNLVGTKDVNQYSLYNETNKITFTTGISHVVFAPTIGVQFRF